MKECIFMDKKLVVNVVLHAHALNWVFKILYSMQYDAAKPFYGDY